jgi:hypothetical protein
MASINSNHLNNSNSNTILGVSSILKNAVPLPATSTATSAPSTTQIFEILSSTFAVAKIQTLPSSTMVAEERKQAALWDKSLCCS